MMLRTYLEAENLKFKRSLFRKLIIFIPIALILISSAESFDDIILAIVYRHNL